MLHQKIILKKAIGQGGFGTVYLAEVQDHLGFRRNIAIKQLNPSLATSRTALARQITEARLLGMLNHENIIQVYDLGFLEQKLSICMEYIEGVSLSELLQTTPIPIRAILEIIGNCADALHSAYNTPHLLTKERLEVIHRDIKPANILISKIGKTKLLDFGIAKANFDRGVITGKQQIGTKRYMAPEQWLQNQVSEKVDIYALGFTFLELLHHKHLSRLALDEQLFSEQQINLIEELDLPEEIQGELRQLLSAMLAYDPNHRPPAFICKQICFQLMEQLSGQTLRIFALETIPKLFEEQIESLSDLPIPTQTMPFTQLQPIHQGVTSQPKIPPPPKTSAKRPLLLLALCSTLFLLHEDLPPASSPPKPKIQHPRLKKSELPPEPAIEDVKSEPAIPAPQIRSPSPPKNHKPPIKMVYVETSFSSIPLGADIFLDGKNIGKTMLLKTEIPSGKHQVRMVFGNQIIEKEITIRQPTRFVWKMNALEEQWFSFLD